MQLPLQGRNMNLKKKFGLSAFVAFAAITVCGFAAPPAEATGSSDSADVIIEWNRLLESNYPSTVSPLHSFRYYAMVHIAMFDAVNSIERQYQPYHVRVPALPVASAEAAAAQAAHDVLVALAPGAQATFDAALQARLATIQPWRAAYGVAIGKRVAQAVLDWRTGDGYELPNPAYTPPALTGVWQPTPPAHSPAAFVHFGRVEPFALLTPTQYLPKPPPLLNSPEYAASVQEVQSLGAQTGSTRTPEQTLIAQLIAPVGYGPNPFGLWNHVARNVATDRHLSLVRAARLFALVNAAMHDGLQTSHSSKFVYGLWRPVTAIRRAAEVPTSHTTTPDPNWLPLITTPPYPSHSSNVACIATSAARTLARVLGGDAVPFTMTWSGTAGTVTRSYSAFSELAAEASVARVYGGIHFRFELEASSESCTQVADYVVRNYAQRR
jgi:hypothetical protein